MLFLFFLLERFLNYFRFCTCLNLIWRIRLNSQKMERFLILLFTGDILFKSNTQNSTDTTENAKNHWVK